MRKFLKGGGQASGEYVMLAGGMIVVAVVIYAVYSGMLTSTGESVNASATSAVETMGSIVENVTASLS